MQILRDKTAVITGAASGIGRALALQLAEAGCRLALCDHNDAALNETRKMAIEKGAVVIAVPFDVSNREDMRNFATEVLQVFGSVDIVVNNAGLTLMQQSVEQLSAEDFQRVWEVNFMGVLHGCQTFLPHLRERPEAALVNVASIFSTAAYPYQGPYVASKFAVRGLTETLRQELAGTCVAVTVVMPGGIKTNIVNNIATTDIAAKEKFARRFDKSAPTTAEEAARCIIEGIRRKKQRVLIGKDAKIMDIIARIFPHRYEQVIKRFV